MSSGALATFAAVATTNFKEMDEQLPKEAGPSIPAVAEGSGWTTVIAGSVVENICVGIDNLKNRSDGSRFNGCRRRRQPLPTETWIVLFDMEHDGRSPNKATLLAENSRSQEN